MKYDVIFPHGFWALIVLPKLASDLPGRDRDRGLSPCRQPEHMLPPPPHFPYWTPVKFTFRKRSQLFHKFHNLPSWAWFLVPSCGWNQALGLTNDHLEASLPVILQILSISNMQTIAGMTEWQLKCMLSKTQGHNYEQRLRFRKEDTRLALAKDLL